MQTGGACVVACAAVVRARLRIDAQVAAFSQARSALALPVAAAGLTLTCFVATAAVLIVVGLRVEAVAPARLLSLRALARAVAAQLAALALMTTTAAVVLALECVHALLSAGSLSLGTLARAVAAHLAVVAAGRAVTTEFGVRSDVDAALPALGQARFAAHAAAPQRTHLVRSAGGSAGAAVVRIGLGVDAEPVARRATAHAAAAAQGAASPRTATHVARAAVRGVD